MEDESSQGVDEHYDSIKFVLFLIPKDKSNVVALVRDNRNTKHAFARLSEHVFVGYHSNRFALTVKDEILGAPKRC